MEDNKIEIEPTFKKLIEDTKMALKDDKCDNLLIYVVARLYANAVLNNYITNNK